VSILFSGDLHANGAGELSYINKKSLLDRFGKDKYGKIQYHIILGDTGFLWPKNATMDSYIFRTLSVRPFPILCVQGNHEPILGLIPRLPETDIGIGEGVYQICSNPLVAFLKRGKVYTIGGYKFLVLGGALSIDLDQRIPNLSWWKEEYWSEQEKKDIFKLLETENAFDYVLSHTGPETINVKAFTGIKNFSVKYIDEVALLNDRIDEKIHCDEWFCGHWHTDRYYYDEERQRGYVYLYSNPVILDKDKDGIVKYY
jgi:3-oxoacid CoA-transferase subunit A